MLKLDDNLKQIEEELKAEIEAKNKKAFLKTSARASAYAQNLAAKRLDDSRPIWEKGFVVLHKSDTEFILQMDGELSKLIEDGFGPGAFTKMIMSGQRAKHNKAQGKDYVDVPIHTKKMPAQASVRNADDLLKDFTVKKYTISDLKNKKVREQEPRLTRIIKTFEEGKKSKVVESKKFKSGSSTFVKFARVTSKSTFPSTGYAGANIFQEVENKLSEFYELALRNQF